MNEEMATAGTGGFSGSATATGPNAGFDPVMRMRAKRKDLKKLVAPVSYTHLTLPTICSV